MRIAAAISATLHIAVFLFVWLGVLPSAPPTIAPAQVIDVEIATEQAKPAPKQKPVAKAKPKPAPPPPPPPRRPPPPKPQLAAKPPETEAVPAPKPPPDVTPIPKPKPKAEKLPKPKPKKAAQKPRPRPKAKPKPPKPKLDFASVLKTVDKLERKPPQPQKRKPKEAKKPVSPMQQVAEALKRKKPAPRLDLARRGITVGDVDAIRRQIEPCWNLPAGARDAHKMVVEIKATVGPDGRVRTAEIVDRARTTNDRFFRSMAESAVRAMLNPRCQPLKLSAEKYHQWRNMTLTFYPGEMF